MKITQEDINRFWNKINFEGDKNCWVYEGTRSSKNNDYCVFWINDKNIGAHRFSYIIHNNFKSLNSNEFVCHKCDHPWCVNPDHLFLGTAKDNTQDMMNKNRNNPPIGSINGMSILNEEDIINILIDINNNCYSNINQIVNNYNVSYATIADILHNRTWKELEYPLNIPLNVLKDRVIDKSSNRNTAKLNKQDVYDIRMSLKNGERCCDLAMEYDVHRSTIDSIKKYKTWKSVKI